MKRAYTLVLIILSNLVNCSVVNAKLADSFVLYKYACVRSEQMPSGASFRPVASMAQCALSYLQSDSSKAMMVPATSNSDGSSWCVLTVERPLPSYCTGAVSDVWVYSHLSTQVSHENCVTYYELYGVKYCVSQTKSSMNYNDSVNSCKSLGGMLAEVETFNQVQFFTSLIKEDTYVYLGATCLYADGKFRWNRGDAVNDALWAAGEQDNSCGIENCAAIFYNKNLDIGLRDVPCSFQVFAFCAIMSQ